MGRIIIVIVVAILLVAVGAAITSLNSGLDSAPRHVVEGAEPEQGELAFVKYGCGGCHEIAGVRTARGKVGPPLTTMGERSYIAGSLPNNLENLMLWIMDPQGVEPGTAMPDLRVTEDDARAMAAYLYSLERR